MDNIGRSYRPNPMPTVNFFSKLFYCWLFPIFMYGENHNIEIKDLYEILPENRSDFVADKLEKAWKVEFNEACKKRIKPSLFKAIRKAFQKNIFKYAIHFFVSYLIFKIMQPQVMSYLIWHFDERSTSSTMEAYGYATTFLFITIFDQILFSHLIFGLRTVGINVRVACASLIYKKILKLPHSSKFINEGRIITLLSNDVDKLEISFIFIHALWIMPMQTILITYIIWQIVGIASIAGVLSLILQTIPIQVFSGRMIALFRRKISMKTDGRLQLTREIIQGIRVIKMYTWEKPFEQLMFFARRHEIGIISRAAYLKSILWALTAFAQRTPFLITVMIYVLQGNSISAHTIFTLVQYFNILHLMGFCFLRAVNLLSEAIASIRRIQEFLLLEEQMSNTNILKSNNEETIISLIGVTVSSTERSEHNFLNNININIKRNLLYAIVGPVAAGKTSLLKLILKEYIPLKGQILLNGNISYASQDPWLFRGTIRSNIIFGRAYDVKRYKQVIKACALSEDFQHFPDGDKTLIGESGITLSGGQCARVNLARAVYRNADIYLLDDPFSAVDSRVSKHLFKNCINGILKDKTRILVTHQLEYLKEADEIIFIADGQIKFQGNFTSFQEVDELVQYLNVNDNKVSDFPDNKENFDKSILSYESRYDNDLTDKDKEKDVEATEKLIGPDNIIGKGKKIDESKESKLEVIHGNSVYWKYFAAGGSCIAPLATLLAFLIVQFLSSSSDYFIGYWTRMQDINRNYSHFVQYGNSSVSKQLDTYTAIYILSSLMVGAFIISIVKMALYTTVCKNSNENIHNKMASSLLRATIHFFQTNNSGRILNRFSKDLGMVDERLQAMLLETIDFFFIVLGVVIQILIINWKLIILVIILVYVFWKGRVIAIKTTRSIMKLEAQAKSPVFSHVNSSFAGVLTIRSCHAESIICKEFDDYQDNHTVAASISQYVLIAYSLWLDLMTLIFMTLLTYSFIVFRENQTSGADVGLAITQVLVLCNILSRGVKLTADIETQMVSVHRLFEYTELEEECSSSNEIDYKLPRAWPNQGKIEFDSLCLRYSPNGPLILKNLTFNIEGGAKIGIVGRTGAGKSSLTIALFRLADIEGSILIDNIDTRNVDLKLLRNKISILPQEPILFSLSLRKNLDPTDEYDDDLIWSAIRDVELNEIFDSLDCVLHRNNLSTGQRQLLCLARAILKKNKILILDEATANVDINTDALIQKIIRAKFANCTVITIAHRLNTVMKCDKILVMDHGKVVEYDSPDVLLKTNDGYLSKMLQHSVKEDFTTISDMRRFL
ncbi:PREDICTED: multidrug resistance-associated protein 4-like [Ceratosolen solmsi marchali]|uniref:Multidrug resistance-associated protein 4-like n=1 Tax=Ceratosolen solmsi marchali TaxID=326594 RepID=A0AAJ6YV18_9HYME|nr:PREDICTED: multidrug resistance-associated protein 4-like [Ceratosolen solmsi marchali]